MSCDVDGCEGENIVQVGIGIDFVPYILILDPEAFGSTASQEAADHLHTYGYRAVGYSIHSRGDGSELIEAITLIARVSSLIYRLVKSLNRFLSFRQRLPIIVEMDMCVHGLDEEGLRVLMPGLIEASQIVRSYIATKFPRAAVDMNVSITDGPSSTRIICNNGKGGGEIYHMLLKFRLDRLQIQHGRVTRIARKLLFVPHASTADN